MKQGSGKDARTQTLDAEEIKLLRLWRSTDARGRGYIMAVAESQQGWDSTGQFQTVSGGERARKEVSGAVKRPTITTPNKSADFLRAKRESQGLSVREAAELIGISPRALARYERQGLNERVGSDCVKRLSHAYGVSIDHLCMLMMQAA